jgi:hypothetical protein
LRTGGAATLVQSAGFVSDPSSGSSVGATLAGPVTSGNSIVGHFNAENFTGSGDGVRPILPLVDDQGNELVIVQAINYGPYNQVAVSFYLPNITNAPDTFEATFVDPIIAKGFTVHEIAGGVDLTDYDATFGFPNFAAYWTPISLQQFTSSAASYVYAVAFNPGNAYAAPHFDFSAWSGTIQEEFGDPLNPGGQIQTVATADIKQGSAGSITVSVDAPTTDSTVLMAVMLTPTSAGGGGSVLGSRLSLLGVGR